MENAHPGDQGVHTDIAALSASVVAVVVATFLVPGTYSAINFILTFVLVATILAYVLPSRRRWPQSLAVAAAIGLACIPGIGFFVEAIKSPSVMTYLVARYVPKCDVDGCECDKKGDLESKVPAGFVEGSWLVILIGSFAYDVIQQRRRLS
jgi:hypothetical protein